MEEQNVIIEDLIEGTGEVALKGALLVVNYVGTLEDGTVFDSTERHGKPYQFVVGSQKVIKGWSLAVLGMKVGGHRKVWIPSDLAYGERQMGLHIKPHSNLIFTIELLEARHRES